MDIQLPFLCNEDSCRFIHDSCIHPIFSCLFGVALSHLTLLMLCVQGISLYIVLQKRWMGMFLTQRRLTQFHMLCFPGCPVVSCGQRWTTLSLRCEEVEEHSAHASAGMSTIYRDLSRSFLLSLFLLSTAVFLPSHLCTEPPPASQSLSSRCRFVTIARC